MYTLDELRPLAIFSGLPDSQLGWFLEQGVAVELARGERMFERGQPAEYMFVVVEGEIERFEEIAGQWLVVATTRAGEVTGMLPFSRMTEYPGHTVAAVPSRVLRVERASFSEMISMSDEVGSRLVALMTDRVRGDVRLEQQREKLMALGKLSAGLAHELNNPAAAMRRTAAGLAEVLSAQHDRALRVVRGGVDEASLAAVDELVRSLGTRAAPVLSSLEQGELEEEILDWLEEQGVDRAWELAPAFAGAGATVDDLRRVGEAIAPDSLGDLLAWLGGGLEAERMAAEVDNAAERIAKLVSAVKSFSQMDRSAEHKPVDVHGGLESTLAMYSYACASKGLRVTKRYASGLPPVPANEGELNQVWSNLIDNAICATGNGGEIRVETDADDWNVIVRVVDDGPGIPEKLQSRIFDPFFTTKDVGEGTGLGLDIALRIVRLHQGNIEVESHPGHTVFVVRLPLEPGGPPAT